MQGFMHFMFQAQVTIYVLNTSIYSKAISRDTAILLS